MTAGKSPVLFAFGFVSATNIFSGKSVETKCQFNSHYLIFPFQMVFFFLTLIKINKISIAPAFHVTPFPTEIQLLCSTHLMLTVANVLQIWKLSELKTHILCVSLTSVILWRQTRKSKTTFATILLPSSHRGRSSLLQHSIYLQCCMWWPSVMPCAITELKK